MTTDIQTAALLANFAELTYHPNGKKRGRSPITQSRYEPALI